MTIWKTGLAAAVTAAAVLSAPAQAADVSGVWLDHTGRGAVRIDDCGGRLCGRVVWLKSAGHGQACGMQVIGDVKPVAGGIWDGGWIYDPEDRKKYQVEISPLANGKLKVVGYLGTKFFSETMIWTRAPAGMKLCNA